MSLHYLILAFMTIGVCILLHQYRLRRAWRPPVITHRTLTPSIRLLSGHSSPLPLLTSRSLPNARLVTAFSICNSFTTTSPHTHRKFLTRARHALKHTSNLIPAAQAFTAELLHPHRPLVPAVRSIVLHTILATFSLTTSLAVHDHVATIAEKINTLWLASKSPAGCSNADKAALTAALVAVFGPWTTDGENPLNLILPAYETLWRATLACFLEVQFCEQPEWRTVMLDTKVGQELEGSKARERDGVVAEHIVLEILRLYPPTKRIHRAISASRVEAADVEAVQRDPAVWGADSAMFKPERWRGVKGTPAGFLTFGAGAFRCPARKDFAVSAVACLVRAMLERVGESRVSLWTAGEEVKLDGMREGGMAGCGREAWEGVDIIWVEEGPVKRGNV